jgi:hypothetical protein
MNNNTKKAIAIGIIALIFLGLLASTRSSRMKNQETVTPVMENSVSSTTPAMTNLTSENSSLMELMSGDKQLKCTYMLKDTNLTSSSTVYIDDKKLRTDAETTMDNGTKIMSHMVSDGEWIYSWTDATAQGMKFNVDTIKNQLDENGEVNIPNNSAFKDLQSKVDYDCSDWQPDNTLFTVPTTVQFTDYTQMMNNVMAPSSTAPTQ